MCFLAATSTTTTAVPKPQEPMFVTVPPRPQRVFHSEAYIKYNYHNLIPEHQCKNIVILGISRD